MAGAAPARLVMQTLAAGETSFLALSAELPEIEESNRPPMDIVCVVDVSGSMQMDAEIQTAGAVEEHGLSILDVVRHAVRTVIHVLGPKDRLALVEFSTTAETVFGLTRMGLGPDRDRAEELLDGLRPKSATNLWDGLRHGLEVLNGARGDSGRNAGVLLLTDGVPNEVPAAGHLPSLRTYRQEHDGWLPTIYTFGFGYDLDSALLQEIANEGDGSYAFIPDASLVGTMLINAASNLLSTSAVAAELILEPQDSVSLGSPPTAGPMRFPLGTLQAGQSREVCVVAAIPAGAAPESCARATLRFRDVASGAAVEVQSVPGEVPGGLRVHWRSLAVRGVQDLTQRMSSESATASLVGPMGELVGAIRAGGGDADPATAALLQDLEGQASEALSRRDWFEKWGRHYLPSLARAHQLQQCNNFKDPGVQAYGGKLFQEIQGNADDMFCGLPPPKGRQVEGDGLDQEFLASLPPDMRAEIEREHRMQQNAARAPVASAAPAAATRTVDMRAYMDASGPCFAGSSRVLLESGGTILLRDLRAGDRLRTPGGGWATVVCVVETPCPSGMYPLCRLPVSGLLITAWHPVRYEGEFRFPADIVEPQLRVCDAIYNLVLDAGHVATVDGVECVSLGHGFQGPVLGHDFYGGVRVIEALSAMDGWASGYVRLSSVDRDADGAVCGLRECSQESLPATVRVAA